MKIVHFILSGAEINIFHKYVFYIGINVKQGIEKYYLN